MTTNSGQADVAGTTQNVEYAGFWVRVAAYLLDYAILMIIFLAIGIGASFAGGAASVIGAIAIFIISLLYFPAMESSARQATFGKSLVGIQVTDLDGRRLSFWRALLRTIAKILSAIPLSIGFLLAAFTKRKQALHDMLAKCLVVRTGPSHLLRTVAMAVGGLVIVVGSGGAYFYYVYLPQMQSEFAGAMQEAAKDTSTTPVPPVAKVAPQAPVTPQVAKASPSAPASVAPKSGDARPDFDSLLGPALTGFEKKPGTTRAGPAILELSQIDSKAVWIKLHLPLIKGIDIVAPPPEITVNSILDASGKNFYDSTNSFESGMFLKASLGRDSNPVPHFSGSRSVQIKPGLTEQSLQKIEGQARIFIPVDVKPVAFAASEAGKKKPVHNATVTLTSLSGAKVELHYQGVPKNFLEVRGYDKNGGLVEEGPSSWSNDDESKDMQINFKAPVSKVEAFVAASMVERQFPFTLVRGALAGPPSPATGDAKPSVLAPPAAASAPASTAASVARLMTPEELRKFQAELAKSTNKGAEAKQQPFKESAAQSSAATDRGIDTKAKIKAKAKSKPVMNAKVDEPPASPITELVVAAPEPQNKVITTKFNDVFTAVMYQDLAAVKELLDLGWWVDKPEPGGSTPLMAAVKINDPAIAELLLGHGANPNIFAHGNSALRLAKRDHNAAMVALLQRYGATVE